MKANMRAKPLQKGICLDTVPATPTSMLGTTIFPLKTTTNIIELTAIDYTAGKIGQAMQEQALTEGSNLSSQAPRCSSAICP